MNKPRTSDEQLWHQCARMLFDDVPCDLPAHIGLGCRKCIPYIHADGSIDHEPGCPTIIATVTTEPDHG